MLKRRVKKDTVQSSINVVPYIDVVFVLLVIFMVTSPFMQQSLPITLPSSDGISTHSPFKSLDVYVRHNAFFLKVGEQSELRFIDLPELIKEIVHQKTLLLSEIELKSSHSFDELQNLNKMVQSELSVRLFAEKNIQYQDVIHVMSALQNEGLGNISLMVEGS